MEKVTKTEDGSLVCLCGNIPEDNGFFPYHNGHEIEPLKDGPWDGTSYVCFGCGRVINYDTTEVVDWPLEITDLQGDTFRRDPENEAGPGLAVYPGSTP